MDNYIVRIYRKEKDDPRLLVGLVEKVGSEGKRAFSNLDELWQILNAATEGKGTGQGREEKRKSIKS